MDIDGQAHGSDKGSLPNRVGVREMVGVAFQAIAVFLAVTA